MSDTYPVVRPLRWGEESVSAGEFVVPAGTVSLLLADVVSSTRLWEERPAEMPAAIADLDRVVAEEVGRRGGVRPVEQGEGDSFVAAFARATDAVDAAVAIQLKLQGGLLRLRIGVHTGEVQVRDSTRYVGEAINRAARLRAAAHGDQILLSRATHELVVQRSSTGLAFADLGLHLLRDLDRREHVFQVVHSDLPADFPPLKSLESFPHNLPVQLTPFLGRTTEMAEVKRLLEASRLLTLTGSGGVGKTRLALQVAADVVDRHPDGVLFVDLSDVSDAARVPAAVGAVVGVPESFASPTEGAAAMVGAKRLLLVLDNCEHVVASCAELTRLLLERCGSLTVIATSREPLGVPGEVVWRVPSMALPTEDDQTLEALEQVEAVQLFAERAQRSRPGLTLDTANAATIADICRRLDGIPLALELAAARARTMSLEDIRDGLQDRFRLLTGGARTAMPRQQTLRASVDWSHDLLTPDEQAAFRRLSVFAGGFTLAAAEAVSRAEDEGARDVIEVITSLVDKSLVNVDASGRYSMTETVRQYADDRLSFAREDAAARDRHLHWFQSWIAVAPGESEMQWRSRIDSERENLRRALEWAAGQQGRALVDLVLGLSTPPFWGIPTDTREAGQWIKLARERNDSADVEAALLLAAARAAAYGYRPSTGSLAQQAVDAYRRIDDRHGLALALAYLGWSAVFGTSEPPNTDMLDEALSLAVETENVDARSIALCGLAYFWRSRQHARARALAEEAVSLWPDPLETRHGLLAMGALAFVRIFQGDVKGALEALERVPQMQFSDALDAYAHALSYAGRLDDATAVAEEALALAEAFGNRFLVASARLRLGLAAALKGDVGRAAEMAETLGDAPESQALVRCAAASFRRDVEEMRVQARILERFSPPFDHRPWAVVSAFLLRESGDPSGAEDAIQEYLSAFDEARLATSVSFSLEALAVLAADAGSAAECARLFGAVARFDEDSGMWSGYRAILWPRQDVREAVERARALIGDERYGAAFEEGRLMSLDEALAYARRGRGERKRPPSGWASLTPTEVQVVDLVAEGLSTAELAARLFVSPATVKTHLVHVYSKLGVGNRAQLATAWASRPPSQR